MTTINDLPNEIYFEIFSFLNVVERQRLETVCKRWQLIIQEMWRSITKLRFHESDQNPEKYIPNCLRLVTRNASHLIDVLKLFNGNLEKLDINHRQKLSRIPSDFFKLLEENKNLNTLRLICRDRNIPEVYFRCLVPKNIRNLVIDVLFLSNPVLISLEKVLMETRSLEFLEIHYYSIIRLGIINELDSLKSLHIDANNEPIETALNLPNLEVLSMQYAEINDAWLIQLVKNCKKLRSLEIRECYSFTDLGLNAIATLPNLRYLNLLKGPVIDSELLSKLSNLEEVYLDLDAKISLDELTSFLRRSPNLKKYGFSYVGHDILFQSAGRIVGVEIEAGGNKYLEDYEWNMRF